VWESQEARAYALLVLTVGLSLLFFARARRRDARPGDLARWAGASVLALATHYFAIFLVLPKSVWLLAVHGRRAAAATGAVALTGAALLPLALEQRSHGGADALIERSGSLWLRVRQVPKQFLVGFDAPAEGLLTVSAGAICIVALVFLLLRGSADERKGAARPAVLAATVLAVPLALALAGLDYLNARNALPAWLPAATVVGAGLATRRPRILGAAGALLLAGIGTAATIAVATEPSYQRDDWRSAAEALGPARAVRAIAFTPPELDALKLYLPAAERLPPAGAEVHELDLLALAERDPGKRRREASPELLPSPPEGFRRSQTVKGETFALVRYRSARGVRLEAAAIRGFAEEPAVLLQRGAP
jgi:hypothetical protein